MAAPPTDEQWTIEQLAAATGMTVRNVRAHQSRGLLPPPSVRGRTGYYGPEHMARLLTIRQMQQEGFNLSAIGSLLAAGDETTDRLRRLRAPILDELEIGPRAELSRDAVEQLRHSDPDGLAALIQSGVIRRLDDGEYAAATPALLLAGRRLAALGMDQDRQLAAMHALVDVARDTAAKLLAITDDLCAPHGIDPVLLDKARRWAREVVRAVLDSSVPRSADLDDELDLDRCVER